MLRYAENDVSEREPDGESSQDFWRRLFPRPVELTALPFDRPRRPAPSFLRESVALVLNVALEKGIQDLSASLAVPPFAILLAALKTVLFDYASQETTVVGGAFAAGDVWPGQPLNRFALLPVQSDWSNADALSGLTLIQGLARRLSDAKAHAQYPLRDLQSWAGARDDAFGARLFN